MVMYSATELRVPLPRGRRPDPTLTGCGALDYGLFICLRRVGHDGPHRPMGWEDAARAEACVPHDLGDRVVWSLQTNRLYPRAPRGKHWWVEPVWDRPAS